MLYQFFFELDLKKLMSPKLGFMAKFSVNFTGRLCCHLFMAIWIDWYLSSHFIVFVTVPTHLSSAIIFVIGTQVLRISFLSWMMFTSACNMIAISIIPSHIIESPRCRLYLGQMY